MKSCKTHRTWLRFHVEQLVGSRGKAHPSEPKSPSLTRFGRRCFHGHLTVVKYKSNWPSSRLFSDRSALVHLKINILTILTLHTQKCIRKHTIMLAYFLAVCLRSAICLLSDVCLLVSCLFTFSCLYTYQLFVYFQLFIYFLLFVYFWRENQVN